MSTKKSNGFLKVEKAMVQSDEWRDLTPRARCALLEFWCKFNGRNNGDIVFGQRELESILGCNSHTAVRVLRELQDKGWIEPTQRGYFNTKTGSKDAKATTWHLTFVTNQEPKES